MNKKRPYKTHNRNSKKTTKTTSIKRQSKSVPSRPIKDKSKNQNIRYDEKTVKSSSAPKQSNKSKLKQANDLRRKTVSTGNACNRIVNNWQNKLQGKPTTERDKINKDYNKRFEQAEKRLNDAYKAYYDYVENNFSPEQITAAKPCGSFTERRFIDRLEKATKQQSKTTTAMTTKKSAGKQTKSTNKATTNLAPRKTTNQPAQKASNQKQQSQKQNQKQGEGDKPSHPQGQSNADKYLSKDEVRYYINPKHLTEDGRPHPARIIAKHRKAYKFNVITHTDTFFKEPTEVLPENPNKNPNPNPNPKPSRVSVPRWENKKSFSTGKLKNWHFSKASKTVIKKLNKRADKNKKD